MFYIKLNFRMISSQDPAQLRRATLCASMMIQTNLLQLWRKTFLILMTTNVGEVFNIKLVFFYFFCVHSPQTSISLCLDYINNSIWAKFFKKIHFITIFQKESISPSPATPNVSVSYAPDDDLSKNSEKII